MVVDAQTLTNLNAQELREVVNGLLTTIACHDQEIARRELTIAAKDREILYRQSKIDQLTHEMAVLKRWKFGRSREQLDAGQISLLDETKVIPPISIEARSRGFMQPWPGAASG